MAVNLNPALNSTALAALLDLNTNQTQLNQTAGEVSSTLSVSNPKDNPAVWSIAQQQSMQVSGLQSVMASLSRATSISDVASAAGQQVSDLLSQLKQDAVSASASDLNDSARQAYNTDFKSVLAKISQTLDNASFDGANLLNGSQSGGVSFLASADGGATLTLTPQNLSLGGSVITLGSTASIGTASQAAAVLSQVNTSLTNVNAALASLGVQASQISDHSSFVGQLSDTLQTGVGDLVNADMGAESARLAALQIQQQMSVQALSLANQSPSVILSMFR